VSVNHGWGGRMKKPKQGESKEGSGITALFFSPKVIHMTDCGTLLCYLFGSFRKMISNN